MFQLHLIAYFVAYVNFGGSFSEGYFEAVLPSGVKYATCY
jgi:hypothetical protein